MHGITLSRFSSPHSEFEETCHDEPIEPSARQDSGILRASETGMTFFSRSVIRLCTSTATDKYRNLLHLFLELSVKTGNRHLKPDDEPEPVMVSSVEPSDRFMRDAFRSKKER